MLYTIRHVTRFTYDTPVRESVMEARMQPRSDGLQRCLHFGLSTTPNSRVLMYQDHDGNSIHHFNIPGRHSKLMLKAEALVEVVPAPVLPAALDEDIWERLDELTITGEFWDSLAPSAYARPTRLLQDLARELAVARGADPLSMLRGLTTRLFETFAYTPNSTRVDSPIDDALRNRQGVCQDFAHIMIALVRSMGIPCRYVSGYLFHRLEDHDRSSDGATHAWVEAWLPDLGWVGFDPTNNLVVGDRHVRVAIGRDYADVPPTRGVFQGTSAVRSDLTVAVTVGPVNTSNLESMPFVPWLTREAEAPMLEPASRAAEQQQQQ
ncbi:MAG: transglutaminase family protein [Vicinamibacterales bacterium]